MENFNVIKHCCFKGKKAFTEDNVPVYNVFVKRIPKQYTEKQLHDYFSQFGHVEKLDFRNDYIYPKSGKYKAAIMSYSDPMEAAKALKHRYHALEKKRQILITACDSWRQPRHARLKSYRGVDFNLSSTAYTSDDVNITLDNDEKHCNVLSLNDDCLEIICRQLNLRSQIYFSHACHRFRMIFEMCCKSQYKTFEMNKLELFTLWEMRHVFETAGPYMKKIVTIDRFKCDKRILEFISVWCRNVKFICLTPMLGRHLNYFRKLCENCKLIETLELDECWLLDDHCIALQQLPKLEHLSLRNNYKLKGIYLNKLKNLKTLNLSGCREIEENTLITVLQSLTKLQTLDVKLYRDCYNTKLYNAMVEYSKNLEDLKIVCYRTQHERLASISKLRRLEMVGYSYPPHIREQFFIELAEKKSNQLEYLKLVCENYLTYERAKYLTYLKRLKYLNCSNNDLLNEDCLRKFGELKELEELVIKRCHPITNEGLMELLRKCKKLKILNIERCSGITNEFVVDAIKLLQERALQMKPLKCWVAKTGITKDIVNNVHYIAATPVYIKLCFDTEFSNDIYDKVDDDDDDHNEENENFVEDEGQYNEINDDQNNVENNVENCDNEEHNDNNVENGDNEEQNDNNENEHDVEQNDPFERYDSYDLCELFK